MQHFTITANTTIESLKKQYRELAKKHHPDRGGSTETMKRINLEYLQAIKLVASRVNCPKEQKIEANELVIKILEELKKHYPDIFRILSMFNQNHLINLLSETIYDETGNK